jgi:hypothetical protein
VSASLRDGLARAALIGLALGMVRPAGGGTAPARPGLVWVFFNDAAARRPAGSGVDGQINLDTGSEIQDYARVWLGQIEAPVAGEVTFHAEADNGLRLHIAARRVIEGWVQPVREGRFPFARAGERVPFRLDFYQDGGVAHVRLYWSWPGHARELVPASAFWHTEEDLVKARAMADPQQVKGAEQVPLSTSKAQVYVPVGENAKDAKHAKTEFGGRGHGDPLFAFFAFARLVTPSVLLDGEALTLNVDSPAGEVRVEALDDAGRPIPGFGLADGSPIAADALAAPVQWKQPLGALKGRPVRLAFTLRNARLFAFDLK